MHPNPALPTHNDSVLWRLWAMLRRELLPLLQLAIPLVAGLASSTFLTITDTYFIGALGALPLAAVSLTSSFSLIIGAALYGFVNPVGILVGQAWGADQHPAIAQILRHGLVLSLVVGTLGAALMAAGYLLLPAMQQPPEVIAISAPYWMMMALTLIPYTVTLSYKQFYDSVERAWTGVGLTLIPVLVNIPLTWLLVEGQLGLPALGLFGAGLATFTAQVIGLIVMLGYYCFAPSLATYRHRVAWHAHSFREQIREGIPIAVQYLSEGGAVALAGILIGWLGANTLAANQVVFSIASMLYMLPLGMSSAVSIRIAQAIGSDEGTRVRGIGFTANAVVLGWMCLFTLSLLIAGESIAATFVADAAVIQIATLMFVSVGVMQVFDGLQSVSLGALRGILDSTWPTIVSLVAYWLIALPLSYLFGFVLAGGGAGVWAGFGTGLAVAGLSLAWRFHQLSQRLMQPQSTTGSMG